MTIDDVLKGKSVTFTLPITIQPHSDENTVVWFQVKLDDGNDIVRIKATITFVTDEGEKTSPPFDIVIHGDSSEYYGRQ